MLTINQKMILLFIPLVVGMFFWVTVDNGLQRIISLFVLVTLSFLLGKEAQKKIQVGEMKYAMSHSPRT